MIGILLATVGLRLARRNRDLLTNRSESPVVLDGIRRLLAADADVVAVGRVASIYIGPHQLVITAEAQPGDEISGVRLRQLLAELHARVLEAVPRASFVFLMPVVAIEPQPELTPWDHDYWLRRYPTWSRPSHEGTAKSASWRMSCAGGNPTLERAHQR